MMVLPDLHVGIRTVLHHVHLLMMTLTYHPLLLPTLRMDLLEVEGEAEMDEVATEVEGQLVVGARLHPEEQ